MQAQHDGDLTIQAATSEEVLRDAMAAALDYVTSIDDRRVGADPAAVAALAGFDEPFPEHGTDGRETLRTLDELGSPATMASTGSRYFGFVIGGTLPVALGSSWLVSAWDQNAALPVASPVAAKLHDVASRWLVDVLHLPDGDRRGLRERRDRCQRIVPRRGARLAAGRPRLGRRRPTGCSARRPCPSWSARRPTRRCRSRSAWSAWVATA